MHEQPLFVPLPKFTLSRHLLTTLCFKCVHVCACYWLYFNVFVCVCVFRIRERGELKEIKVTWAYQENQAQLVRRTGLRRQSCLFHSTDSVFFISTRICRGSRGKLKLNDARGQ